MTGSSSRPAPLGQTLQQEQSPSVLPSPTFASGSGDVVQEKAAAVAAAAAGAGAGIAGAVGGAGGAGGAKTGVKVVKKAPVPAAKRGLKRL
jgi:hypothetical protein